MAQQAQGECAGDDDSRGHKAISLLPVKDEDAAYPTVQLATSDAGAHKSAAYVIVVLPPPAARPSWLQPVRQLFGRVRNLFTVQRYSQPASPITTEVFLSHGCRVWTRCDAKASVVRYIPERLELQGMHEGVKGERALEMAPLITCPASVAVSYRTPRTLCDL